MRLVVDCAHRSKDRPTDLSARAGSDGAITSSPASAAHSSCPRRSTAAASLREACTTTVGVVADLSLAAAGRTKPRAVWQQQTTSSSSAAEADLGAMAGSSRI